MRCSLHIPLGKIWNLNGTRIVLVEIVDEVVLRTVIEKTGEEYFHEVDGLQVRLTIQTVIEEFAAGRLVEVGHSSKTQSEWNGRYLGLDWHAVLAQEPRAFLKYRVALEALKKGLPRNAEKLREFAATFWPDRASPVPCGRSIIRWMDILQNHDERIGALRNRSGRAKGASQLPPKADLLVQQAVALYFSAEHLKKMDIYAHVVSAWTRASEADEANLGSKPPSKTAVINRINASETKKTFGMKFGRHEADRHFDAAGVSAPVSRPFELVYFDAMEFEQVCHFSAEARIASNKMKAIWAMDAASLYVFPSTPFAGDARSEMSMGALLGVLTRPVLDAETLAKHPERALFFDRIGRLRTDNDRALVPPSAIANLAAVITRVELSKKYGPDEKASVENFHGFLLRRLDGEPGTVLSARSRRRSIRRDPLGEATMTRSSFCLRVKTLVDEWNDTAHRALGYRTPNEIMAEHRSSEDVHFTDTDEIRRHLARTVSGVLTTDGIEFDSIRYKWNRDGVTQLLSDNLAAQSFASRLEGTARCEVSFRVYDWNLDFIEVFDEANRRFVTLWSDDPEYTTFLSRFEHKFHLACTNNGTTGAQTGLERALRRAEGLARAEDDLHNQPYGIRKKAAALLESAEFSAKARNVQNDPDLTDFRHFMIETNVAGLDRADAPRGPSQKRQRSRRKAVSPIDWSPLESAPRSNLQMLERDREDDLDGGIDWDDVDGSDSKSNPNGGGEE